MDRYEARRRALQQLIDSMGRGAIAAVATAIDKQPSYVSRMLYPPGKNGRKRIGEDSWSMLIEAFPSLRGGPDHVAGSTAGASARELLPLATPRTHKALQDIITAAETGKLDEADLQLLNTIAKRLRTPGPKKKDA